MESEETCKYNAHEASQRLREEQQELRVELKIVAKGRFDGHRRGSHDEPCADDRVEQKQEEIFVVVEANTIIYPRAMVIHT